MGSVTLYCDKIKHVSHDLEEAWRIWQLRPYVVYLDTVLLCIIILEWLKVKGYELL